MTPPTAAATPAGRLGAPGTRVRRAAPGRVATPPRGARRVSGPRGGFGALRVDTAPAAAGTLAAPLGLRLARRAATVPDARLLDRLIRGRTWIVLVGGMLIGLVFLQVSLLSLNAGIGQSMQRAQTLERQNSALRTQVSQMDAGQRVQDAAVRNGLTMPTAGSVHYLRAGRIAPAIAVRGITPPDPQLQTQANAAAAAAAATAAPAATVTTPAATDPSAAAATLSVPTTATTATTAAVTPTATTTSTPPVTPTPTPQG